MKRPTVNPNIKSVINTIIDKCVTNNAKRGLKILSKMTDMSYMVAFPAIASQVLIESGIINKEKKEVNILIHSAIEYDCVDHFRWFALIPFLVNQMDLKVNVVATVNDVNSDTLTKYRNVIDAIIVRELGNRFTSELVQDSIASVINHYGVKHFDIVLNDIPSSNDISKQEDCLAIKQIIDYGVPYVIVDFSPVTLLHKYNMYKIVGFSGAGELYTNIHGLNFTKTQGTKYQHCGHYLVLENTPNNFENVSDTLQAYNLLEKSIVYLLEHGDTMTRVPSILGDDITVFEGVKLNQKSGFAELNYLGDNFLIQLKDHHPFPAKLDGQSDIDFKSDLAYWGINTYTQILNELILKQGESA